MIQPTRELYPQWPCHAPESRLRALDHKTQIRSPISCLATRAGGGTLLKNGVHGLADSSDPVVAPHPSANWFHEDAV